jgi:hypothetical protein
MRRKRLRVIVLVVVAFLAVSAGLARVFSAEAAERSAITDLVKAEARGDGPALLARLAGCSTRAGCRARVAATIASLRRSGPISILQLEPSTGFSLGGETGTARVAWRVGSSLPIVQCVRVRRTGDAISGIRIQLLALSLRIKSDADCPRTF